MLGIFFGIVFMAIKFCEHIKPNRYSCGDVVEYEYDGSVHVGMVVMTKLTFTGYANTGYKLIRIYRINDSMRNYSMSNNKTASVLSGSTLVLQDNIFRKIMGDR